MSRLGLWSLCAVAIAAVSFISSTGASRAEEKAAQVANPLEGRSDLVEEGRSLYGQYCSHCHGQDAIQGERPRDLRRLKLRYGDEAPKAFHETVSSGRLDMGMPAWKGALSDVVLWRIYTYLQTVQTQ